MVDAPLDTPQVTIFGHYERPMNEMKTDVQSYVNFCRFDPDIFQELLTKIAIESQGNTSFNPSLSPGLKLRMVLHVGWLFGWQFGSNSRESGAHSGMSLLIRVSQETI